MNAREVFARFIEAKCGYECPATQDAIDRLVAGERFRTRANMLDVLRGANYDGVAFVSSLLSAWKPEDIWRATGQPRDWWIDLNERMIDIRAEDHGAWRDTRGVRHTEWSAIDDATFTGPDSPMGTGSTDVEAITYLVEQITS